MNDNNDKVAKKKHPFKTSNLLSKLFFSWCLKEWFKNNRTKLTETALYENLDDYNAKTLGDKLQGMWHAETSTSSKPSLAKVFVKFLGWKLALTGVMFLAWEIAFSLGAPVLTKRLLDTYSAQNHPNKLREIYINIFGIFCLLMLRIVTLPQLLASHFGLGIKLRIACSALIFRKALTLKRRAMQTTTVGHIVNLLSNDVRRFDSGFLYIHHLWIVPVNMAVSLTYFYIFLGKEIIYGAVFQLGLIFLIIIVSKVLLELQQKIVIKTDLRIRGINDMVCGIQVIKMYVWEKPCINLVKFLRKSESNLLLKAKIVKLLLPSLKVTTTRVNLYFYFLACFLFNVPISPQIAFSSVIFYDALRRSINAYLFEGITALSRILVSIQRIESFFLNNDTQNSEKDARENASSWIRNFNKIEPCEVFKSTKTRTQYVSISAENVGFKWTSNSTYDNLNGVNFEVSGENLVAVIGPSGSGKSTLLQLLTLTLEPDSGVVTVNGSLSYCSQEPWIFPATVRQNILFNQKFDADRYKTVVQLCGLRRDLHVFPSGDQTLVGERGVMLSGGQKARINLARAVYKNADIYLLDDPLSAVDGHVSRHIFEECFCRFLGKKCVIFVTHQLRYLASASKILYIEQGAVVAEGVYSEICHLKQFQQLSTNLSKTINERKKSLVLEAPTSTEMQKPRQAEETLRKHKLVTIIKRYCAAGGPCLWFFGVCITSTLIQVVANSFDFFISLWKQETYSTPNTSNIAIAGALLGIVLVVIIIRVFTFSVFTFKASNNLHFSMTESMFNSPMKFFNSTPSGQILNRFSKDFGMIDDFLPQHLLETLQFTLHIVGGFVYISCANAWFIVPSAVFLLVFGCFVNFYTQSNKNIMRIEAASCSPLYSHLAASLQGVTTITVAGAQTTLSDEFDKHQDKNTVANHIGINCQFAFRFWVDVSSLLYIVIILCWVFRDEETPLSKIGVLTMQLITLLGPISWWLKSMTELDSDIVAVERIIEYSDLPPEEDAEKIIPPQNWPLHGSINFQSVSLKYLAQGHLVLNKVSFSVKSKEKIGIIGRTGAGKSSLVAALLRLFDFEGNILIDNVNTKHLSLRNLRADMSVIPQDPVLFSGCLRKNLDPFGKYSDASLWSVLQEVELKEAVERLPSGLDSQVGEKGENFSYGQKQLLCLARVLLRKPKIIVLDEATANVDIKTDAIIQKTIRNKFKDSTVLTVAHRLNTVMDSDQILVMSDGQVVEFGPPEELLRDTQSLFYKNVSEYGEDVRNYSIEANE